MLSSIIYKVNHLIDKDKIGSIYVFYGNSLEVKDPEDLFKREPNHRAFIDSNTGIHRIFNKEEMAIIFDNNGNVKTPVYFVDQQIHYDDTIGTIKIKIVYALSKRAHRQGNAFSTEEIYMFCAKHTTMNPINIYQTLTQNGKLELTRIRLDQFLLNIKQEETHIPIVVNNIDKLVYDYDDILALDLANKKYWVNIALGQKLFIVSNEYPYICNPFEVIEYDEFIERATRKSLSTLNNHLLLNTGHIRNNTIHLCLASDVLKTSEKRGISIPYSLKLYYPFLFKKGIDTLDKLEETQEKRIEENLRIMSPAVIDTFRSIDLLYDVYKERTQELKYINKGSIKFIKLVMHPVYKMKIPLDIIFKLIHAEESIPLIKYNPASRRENLYRLYTPEISTDGRKIPLLTKSTIFKLMRTIGKSKSVAVYVNYKMDNMEYSVLCEFEDNGDIAISCDFDAEIVATDQINTIFSTAINPIISEVKNYLEQSGYTVGLFQNITGENVEIRQIIYETVIEIAKPVVLSEFVGCITSAFIIESTYEKGIDLRFKRVSNFNKVTSQEAFIIEKQKQGFKRDEIVQGLVENYSISEEDALHILAKMVGELQVERGVRGNDIEVKINPGFKTILQTDPFKSTMSIRVENINDVNYLYTIPVYLDTLIRLTQDVKSTRVPEKDITDICLSSEKEDFISDDIVSSSELPYLESDIPIIEDDELSYENDAEYADDNLDDASRVPNALDLWMNDEEEEEEEEEVIAKPSKNIRGSRGGADSDDSLESFGLEEGDILGLEDLEGLDVGLEEEKGEKREEKSEGSESSGILPPDSLYTNRRHPSQSDSSPNVVRNIDGMSLTNKSNPFFNKMYEKDPILFVTKKQGTYKAYSRICSSSARRQPVLLTDEELAKIEKDQPGIFKPEDVIRYGSNPDKQFNYICPRYWCLKTQSPISPKDALEGKKCGKIIPRDAKKVPKGHYIYEFFDQGEHGTQEKYIQHYPGFIKEGNHPDDLCIPCCFKNWNTPAQIERREQCAQNGREGKTENKKEPEIAEIKSIDSTIHLESPVSKPIIVEPTIKRKEKDDYIKGPEKFPLDKERWGYLPISIQHFLGEDNTLCQIGKTNTNIKPGHTCILRRGVESNDKQSFIACIADAMFYGKTTKDVSGNTVLYSIPNVQQMKAIIIQSLDRDIDSFIAYQNGNLIVSFSPENKGSDNVEVDLKKYSESKLYKKIMNNDNHDRHSGRSNSDKMTMIYLNRVILAFENFIAFLKSEDSVIDYSYLWDIICKPNPKLFPQGINLLILEIPDNDITDNVEIICPTNHYSNEFYEARKQTLILLRQGNYFEPIYAYLNNDKKGLSIKKTFSEYDPHMPEKIRKMFGKLKPIIRDSCLPLKSMPNKYTFVDPIPLNKLLNDLNKLRYTIDYQVMNFRGKVNGVVSTSPSKKTGFTPCYPSSINSVYDYVFMDDDKLFSSYKNTVQFLNELYLASHKSIPCKPVVLMVEEEHVVGLLTMTNQFISFRENSESGALFRIDEIDPDTIWNAKSSEQCLKQSELTTNKDKLCVINESNYIMADEIVTTSNKKDTERIKYINRIKLETGMFQVFRNTVRILLNKYENIRIREKVEEESKMSYLLYSDKLKSVVELLHTLLEGFVVFSEKYDSGDIPEMATCVVMSGEMCESKQPLCNVDKQQNKCQLVLPKHNLIQGTTDNETLYFARMADELIRYKRINTFLFQPQGFLSFGNLTYNLRDDEIILIQSLLNTEYFDGLIPVSSNSFVTYNAYDTAEPKITQVYDNVVDLESASAKVAATSVNYPITKISSAIWRSCFPVAYTEKPYDNANESGFELVTDILNKVKGITIDVQILKRELIYEYLDLVKRGFLSNIEDIFKSSGKRRLVKEMHEYNYDVTQIIRDRDFFLSNFDLWLLMKRYKVPSVLISTYHIQEANNEKNIFVMYGNKEDKFVFIIPPTVKAVKPKYSLIQNEIAGEIIIQTSISELNVDNSTSTKGNCKNNIIDAIENKKNVVDYVESFVPLIETAPKKKRVLKIVEKIPSLEFEREEEEGVMPKLEEWHKKKMTVSRKQQQLQLTGVVDKTKTRKARKKVLKILPPDVGLY